MLGSLRLPLLLVAAAGALALSALLVADAIAWPSGGIRPSIEQQCDVTLRGTPHREVIVGNRSNDRIRSYGGNDIILGLKGDDCLNPGAARDTVYGGSGDDIVFVEGKGSDVVNCGSGYDFVRADRFDNVFSNCEYVLVDGKTAR